MRYSLEGVKVKVARAAEHLEALSTEGAAYLDSEPYEIVGQSGPEGDTLLVCKVHRLPPIRLSALLGDFLHNLRSSLDHLAWQLVLVNGGTPKSGPGGTQFPILKKRGKYSVNTVGGVAEEVADLIEKLQPYNNKNGAPSEDPLWVLSTLNNVDKHREFNIAVLNVSEIFQADLFTADGTGIYMTFQFPSNVGKDRPITDGEVIGKTPFPAGDGQKWRVGVETRLGLRETKEVGSLESLSLFGVGKHLLDYVQDTVVPEFEHFF